MNQSDTPRTDARWERLCCSGQSWYQIAEEMKLDCRQKERELTAARAELTASCLREQQAHDDYKYQKTRADDALLALNQSDIDLKSVTEQRDRLAEALRFYEKHMKLGYEITDSGQVATKALQSLTPQNTPTQERTASPDVICSKLNETTL